MTADNTGSRTSRRGYFVIVVVAIAAFALGVAAFWLLRDEGVGNAPTIGEQLIELRAERAAMQARADGMARVELLPSFRAASLLSDALVARYEAERERAFERLTPARRQAFAELVVLNAALRDAVDRPGEGARQAAADLAGRIAGQLERAAALDESPVVLSYGPLFVPPRRATGELTLAPSAPGVLPDATVRPVPRGAAQDVAPPPTVPRYAPEFAATGDDDPPVEIEVAGLRMTLPGAPPPVLAIGTWRGEAIVTPERLRFSVPRSAFPTEVARTVFSTGSLLLRHGNRSATFQLLFTVLPDRPGSFALDQRLRTTVPESNTLVSPEILARAPAGETRTVRRCFDPPPGWRFDKAKRRVVIVERLGWLGDIPDETMNGGSVEFAAEEEAQQICLVVVAKPVTKGARTATIGRFEATLVRDRPVERTAQSGVRALDWREPARVALEPGMIEWKLYVRLFDEISREFAGKADASAPPISIPFLRVSVEGDGNVLVLRADPGIAPPR